MTAYVLAHLRVPRPHADFIPYVERIQATLDAYGGRFLVHGGRKDVVEGAWPGDVVLLEFRDAATARAWYTSPGYQEILPLRTAHMVGDVVLVDGVAPGYDPVDKADDFRAALAGG
jgi:uncharacterized protein (DUF1330 family)